MTDWCTQDLGAVLSMIGSTELQIHSVDPVSWMDKAIIPLASTFFGAVGGSMTIIAVEWWRQRMRLLADINASIAIFGNLLNTLVNIKGQFILELTGYYESDVQKFQALQVMKKLNPNPSEPVVVSFSPYLKRYDCPMLFVDAPLERIFAEAHKGAARTVQIITQAKTTVKEIEVVCGRWNEMIEKMQSMPENDRGKFYFGQPISTGVADTCYPDTVQCLKLYTDDALFFANRSVTALQKLGQQVLPFWLKKRVGKIIMDDERHKSLMPPENHLEGWNAE